MPLSNDVDKLITSLEGFCKEVSSGYFLLGKRDRDGNVIAWTLRGPVRKNDLARQPLLVRTSFTL